VRLLYYGFRFQTEVFIKGDIKAAARFFIKKPAPPDF
jgi:hypothetical protein